MAVFLGVGMAFQGNFCNTLFCVYPEKKKLCNTLFCLYPKTKKKSGVCIHQAIPVVSNPLQFLVKPDIAKESPVNFFRYANPRYLHESEVQRQDYIPDEYRLNFHRILLLFAR